MCGRERVCDVTDQESGNGQKVKKHKREETIALQKPIKATSQPPGCAAVKHQPLNQKTGWNPRCETTAFLTQTFFRPQSQKHWLYSKYNHISHFLTASSASSFPCSHTPSSTK